MAKNDEFLKDLQAKLSESGSPWVAESNEIFELSDAEKKQRLGYLPEDGELSFEKLEEVAKKNHQAFLLDGTIDTAPSAIDWTNIGGKNFVSPVENQGGCGSCVAFGAGATAESRVKVIRNLPEGAPGATKLQPLSEEQLFFCGNLSANPCAGWYNSAAVAYFRNSGVVPESCYPYVARNSPCNINTVCPDWKNKVTKTSSLLDDGGSVIGNKGFSTTNDMKEWISTNGPLLTRFNVYQDFFAYRSGVYKHTTGNLVGGHAVSVVGYDDNMAGGAWKCKNSWGSGWADLGGFFWIGYGQCGIDAYMFGFNAFENIYPFHNYTTLLPNGTITYQHGTYSGSVTDPIWTPLNPNQYTGVNGQTGFQCGDIVSVTASFYLNPPVEPKPNASDYKGLSIGACSAADTTEITALLSAFDALPGGNTGELLGTGITSSDTPSDTDVFYNATAVKETIQLTPTSRGTLTEYCCVWYMVYNGNNTVVTNGDDVEIVCGYSVGMTSKASTSVTLQSAQVDTRESLKAN